MNGTTTVPVPWLVVAVTDFAPLVVKRPKSVVKVITMPSAAVAPVEVTGVAVIVVELAPSAARVAEPAVRFMPTIGGVGVGVLVEVELDAACSACFPLPTFSHPASMPIPTRPNDTSSHADASRPQLGRTYRYLLPCLWMHCQPSCHQLFDELRGDIIAKRDLAQLFHEDET
jgi:hypothetical protein